MLPKYRMTRGRPQISGYRLLRLQVLPRRHPRAPTAVPFEFAGLELGCHIAGSIEVIIVTATNRRSHGDHNSRNTQARASELSTSKAES